MLEPDPNGPAGYIRCVELDQHHPLRGEQGGQPPKQYEGVAADAEVAAGEQRRRPPAGARQSVEHRPDQDERAAVPGELGDAGSDVDTEHRQAAGRQSDGQPAGSATDVQGRTGASIEQARVAGMGGGGPDVYRQRAAQAVGIAQQQR